MKYTKDNVIGGSEIPTIVLNKGRFTTPNEIMHKKLAAKSGEQYEQKPISQNALDRGNFLEPGILNWASDVLDSMCLEKTFVRLEVPKKAFLHKKSRIGVSLDGLIHIKNGELQLENPFGRLPGETKYIALWGSGPLEVKTDAYDDGPPHIENVIQLQAQMLCLQADWGVIAKLGPKMRLGIYPYHRNEELCEKILKATDDFWRRCDNNPPIHYLEAVEEVVSEKTVEVDPSINTDVGQLVEDYISCKDAMEEQELAFKESKETLQLYMSSLDPDDKTTIHAKINGYTITYKKITRQAQPDKMVPAKPETSHRKLTITKGDN